MDYLTPQPPRLSFPREPDTDTVAMGLAILEDQNDQEENTLHDEDSLLLCQIHQKLAHLADIYNSGKPLFPRTLLADLSSQIEEGHEEVYINDLDDVRHKYSLKIPSWCADVATTYRISYSSIQTLTCIHPSFPEISLRDNSPISICYTSSSIPESGSGSGHTKVSFEAVKAMYAKNARKWVESETCKTLEHHLSTLRSRISRPIRKIIGFGLGTLSLLQEGDEYHCLRAHAQHAAISTMAGVLSTNRKAILNGAGEEGIKCYVQDPAYTEVDQALLKSIGITPLDDPKGFLEIDEETLIFSVSPNVPVKQVVADVQWPGAMIWNTVCPEETDNARWEKQMRNGEEFWVVPFTTDPDSQRVRRMVQHYTSVPLRDANEYFGDLTIYVR